MKTCPECNSPIEESKSKYICSECDFSVKKNLVPSEPHMYVQEPFHNEAFEYLPSVIAHEYWRLSELYKSEEYYGAFLQLKDIFEVVIKFPTLIGLSSIYQKRDRTEKEIQILVHSLSKLLSLGDWKAIATDLLKTEFAKEFNDLPIILGHIVKMYDHHHIVNWRNTNLGHGALAFHFDLTTKKDIEKKLQILNEHFTKFSVEYKNIPLFLHSNEALIKLIGKEKAREFLCSDAEILFQRDGGALPLSPFISYLKSGIYFFDSFASLKGKTSFINYPEGETYVSIQPEFSRLYKTLIKEGSYESVFSSVEDEVYIKTEERFWMT
jgi:hypothetical protein